ncbi:MAG: TrkA family potassium uptake protein [Candidatus Omnitrophica bacterium]|nr:TrkA family potassium uptake protein [Candidatus Omnitrophota bacterium]
MKQIAIIGAGNFGKNLALNLAREGAEVLVIDINKAKIEAIKDEVTRAIIADASKKDALKAIGFADFDIVVVSLGERIDVSVMAILFLKELGIKKIIAKANNEDYAKAMKLVGADEIIFPEKDVADRLAHFFLYGDIVDYITLSEQYGIIEIAVPETLYGKSIQELDFRKKYLLNIIAVKNPLKDKMNIVPPSDYRFQPDDSIVVLGEADNINKLKKLIKK